MSLATSNDDAFSKQMHARNICVVNERGVQALIDSPWEGMAMAFMTTPFTEYSPFKSMFQFWRGVAGALHPYGLTDTTPNPLPTYLEAAAFVPARRQAAHQCLSQPACCIPLASFVYGRRFPPTYSTLSREQPYVVIWVAGSRAMARWVLSL